MAQKLGLEKDALTAGAQQLGNPDRLGCPQRDSEAYLNIGVINNNINRNSTINRSC